MGIGKRGEAGIFESMGTLTEILLIAVIAIAFISFAGFAANKSPVEVKFFSRELSMATLLAEASPGQLLINYSPPRVPVSRFIYSWDGSNIHVSDPSGQPSVTYGYIWDQTLFTGNVKLENPKAIFFMNDREKLTISDTKGEIENNLQCPKTSFKPEKILLDPGHGEETDTGVKIESDTAHFVESEITCSIARLIHEKLIGATSTRPVSELGITNCIGTYRLPDGIIAQFVANSDLVLSIHIGNNLDGKNVLKAFASSPDAAALACKMLAQIRAADDNVDAILQLQYTGNYPGVMPVFSKPVIILEIGNAQSAKSLELLKDLYPIAGKIAGVLNG